MTIVNLGEVRSHRELTALNRQRRYDYWMRRQRYLRDGRTPPMQWFDPPEDPKQSMREAMKVLLGEMYR